MKRRTSEPSYNIRMVCQKHAPKPDPKWKKVPKEFFVGKYVKRAFAGISVDNEAGFEHMWVRVTEATDTGLRGTLNNNPTYKMDLMCYDTVSVKLSEIEAVLDEKGRTVVP